MKFGLYSIKDAKTGFMTPVLEQETRQLFAILLML